MLPPPLPSPSFLTRLLLVSALPPRPPTRPQIPSATRPACQIVGQTSTSRPLPCVPVLLHPLRTRDASPALPRPCPCPIHPPPPRTRIPQIQCPPPPAFRLARSASAGIDNATRTVAGTTATGVGSVGTESVRSVWHGTRTSPRLARSSAALASKTRAVLVGSSLPRPPRVWRPMSEDAVGRFTSLRCATSDMVT